MNCERIQELYTEYYEKSISGTLLEAVDHHLKVCTDCRSDYAHFAQAMRLLDIELPEVEAPASFRANILATIESQPRRASAAGAFWSRLRGILAPDAPRLRTQLITGYAIAAVVLAGTLFTVPLWHSPNADIFTPIIRIHHPHAPYAGIFRTISSEVRSDQRTYHDFTLHLPTGQTNGTINAYVIQDDKALKDDSVLSDNDSITPVWSQAQSLDSDHSLNVPVAVVSDLPAGTTLTLMVKENDPATGATRRDAAFVPVNSAPGAWNPVTVPQGSSLFNTLQTIASAGSYPIVLDDSVIEASGSNPSIVSTFQSAPTPGGEVSERDELRDALVSVPSLRVVPVTGDDGAVDLYAIVSR